MMKVYENMRQKRVMASYGCKYNCISYCAKFSIFMSKFVQRKYGKNIQHAGMENKQYTFCLYNGMVHLQ